MVIVLTALYSLIQWPFTEMILGLKFARMRIVDGLSSTKEQELFNSVKKRIGCWFYIRFWLTYWFAWPYFNYLASSGA